MKSYFNEKRQIPYIIILHIERLRKKAFYM